MPHSPDDIEAAKTEARTRLLSARREQVSGRDLDADDHALAGGVLALATDLGLSAGDTVAAYEAFGTEPRTAASVAALVARGIRVIVPITLSDNDLDWCDVSDHSRMPLGPDTIATAALIVVPGVAVDHRGMRLGRGGGSYDRALARRGAGSRAVIVLHPGEVSETPLPHDAHDLAVDGALTADGLTWFRTPPE